MGLQKDREWSLWFEETDRLKPNDERLHLPSFPDQYGLSSQGNYEWGDEGRDSGKETVDYCQRGDGSRLGEKIWRKIQQEKWRT